MSASARIAVVGAGYAGMAAAVTLAERGIGVTVFEAGSVPGGRARRIESHGILLDNGQHVLLGAYRTLLELMHKVGVPSGALLRVPLELHYADGFALRAWHLPAPLGLLAGLLSAKRLPLIERLAAIRFMHAMRGCEFRIACDCSVAELLSHHGQRGAIARYVWEPLCVSALNTLPAHASANVFLAVVRDGLAGGRGDSDLLLPRLDLSRLFPEPAAEYVRARGGEMRYDTRAPLVVELRRRYERLIVAVGPHQLKALFPEMDVEYSYQPIYTCYLQYPETTQLPVTMLGLGGNPVQWVFDRGALLGEHGRMACVISAEGAHQAMTQDALAQACHAELARAVPGLAPPAWSRVIAEKRATVRVDVNLKRLGVHPAPDVVLAGDYLDAEYPPTLEAAVRSGVRAASLVIDPSSATRAALPA